jgi:hypothetical protein
MRVYITKYALTRGIYEIEATRSDHSKYMVNVKARHWGCMQHFHKGEWHESFEAAKLKAEEIRDRKISALKTQINKLAVLDFTDLKALP